MKGLFAIFLLFSAAFPQAPGKKSKDAPSPSQDLFQMGERTRFARSTGNLLLERLLLIRSVTGSGDLGTAATCRLAYNALDGGNYGLAVDALTTGRVVKGSAPTRDDQVLLGEAYLRAGDTGSASAIFVRMENIANVLQPDDAAVRAVKGLDAISRDVDEAEHLRRAAIYQADRDFALARAHFQAVIDASPAGANAADSAFQIGRGYSLATDHAQAINWYERVLEQYPQSPSAKDALLQAASGYARVGKPKEAIKRYQRFIEMYPADERLDRAYLNIADVYRDQGEDREALKWCSKAAEAFKGKGAEALAIFAMARIFIAREEWADALNSLDQLRSFSDLAGNAPGGTDGAEITFLRAIVLDGMGRYGEAIDAYLTVPGGRDSYYGYLADDRLANMKKVEASRGYIDQKLGALSGLLGSADGEPRRVSALAVLRLTEHADVRARAMQVLKQTFKPVVIPKGAPDAYRSKGSVLLAESAFRKVPADEPVDLIPKEALRQLYPLAFERDVVRYSKQRNVDPRYVLSIMRQESRFDPLAHSNASARGLMQLIMSTANAAGGALDQDVFGEDDLLDPSFSILLGTQHLSDLFKAFPGQPDAVAAAYNASADNVKRWSARAKANTPDRYVSEIMFAQTKDYVRKVMANYRMYQYLYEEDLEPR